ncbi:MAG: hypothetical protein EOO28_25315 [Comamonadaceae bacterium]|nr:MAG: hypothetical protein EOO28_25315 [Comamonadaceae bacterium]
MNGIDNSLQSPANFSLGDLRPETGADAWRAEPSPDGQSLILSGKTLRIRVDRHGPGIELQNLEADAGPKQRTHRLFGYLPAVGNGSDQDAGAGVSTGVNAEGDAAGRADFNESATVFPLFGHSGDVRLLVNDGKGTQISFVSGAGHTGSGMAGDGDTLWAGSTDTGFVAVGDLGNLVDQGSRRPLAVHRPGIDPCLQLPDLSSHPEGLAEAFDDFDGHGLPQRVFYLDEVMDGGAGAIYDAFSAAGCRFNADENFRPWQDPAFWQRVAQTDGFSWTRPAAKSHVNWGMRTFIPGLPASAPFVPMPLPAGLPSGISPLVFVRSHLLSMQRAIETDRVIRTGAYSQVILKLPTFAGGHCVFRFSLCVTDCPHRTICRSANRQTDATPCQAKKTNPLQNKR